MAEQIRYAIQGQQAPHRLIPLPEGCAEYGARRHAAEHATELQQPVAILSRADDTAAWVPVDVVQPWRTRTELGRELARNFTPAELRRMQRELPTPPYEGPWARLVRAITEALEG